MKIIEDFIKLKVEQFEIAERLPDAELIGCNEKERWQTESKYAAMKKGRKSALRLCDTEEEAKAIAGCEYVEYRPGVNRKCEDYCNCKNFCPFYKTLSK